MPNPLPFPTLASSGPHTMKGLRKKIVESRKVTAGSRGGGRAEGEAISTYEQEVLELATKGDRRDKMAFPVARRDISKEKEKVHLSTGPCTNGRSEARLLPILHSVRIPTPVCLTEAYYLLMAFDENYSNLWCAMLTYMGEFVNPTGLIVPDDFQGWSRELFEIKDRFPMIELRNLKNDPMLMSPHGFGDRRCSSPSFNSGSAKLK